MPHFSQPQAFHLRVPDEDLEDLRRRLQCVRWPDQPPGEPWTTGTDLAWLQQLVAYWRDRFDWRAQEARLNAFPQFTVELAGVPLHWLQVQGKGPSPTPLLLAHGWPGSVFEFLELIPRLTDPVAFGGDAADAFTVIVPSLPGYGLSFRPGQPRQSAEQIADLFVMLMSDVLGFERFGVQGGDWGATIGARIGQIYPQRTIGLHLNYLPLPRTGLSPKNEDERRYQGELAQWLAEETGYAVQQGTRPQTLAYALTDSPVGLAAWITEKFHAWSDCEGNIDSVFDRDTLLADVSLYWLTGAIGSSFWPYYARVHAAQWPISAPVGVPVGYAEFPREVLRPPRSLAETLFTHIHRWTVMPRGGHFAALEQPHALAEDIRSFFRSLRQQTAG